MSMGAAALLAIAVLNLQLPATPAPSEDKPPDLPVSVDRIRKALESQSDPSRTLLRPPPEPTFRVEIREGKPQTVLGSLDFSVGRCRLEDFKHSSRHERQGKTRGLGSPSSWSTFSHTSKQLSAPWDTRARFAPNERHTKTSSAHYGSFVRQEAAASAGT
jgi:hypothetical protein